MAGLSSSSGDPDADAAFGGPPTDAASAAPDSSGDPDADAAVFASDLAPAAKRAHEADLEALRRGPDNPVSNFLNSAFKSKYNPINWPQDIADRGADILASGSQPGQVTNPEAKNPENWRQVEPPSPVAATALHMGPTVLGAAGGYKSLTNRAPLPTRLVPVDIAAAGPQSMGAAHAAPNLANASPEVQAAYAGLTPEEIAHNRPVIDRHLEAQSLPVKIKLTEGQATQNPDIVSREMNNRGATGLSAVLKTQGDQLKGNLRAIREQVGPDVFSTNAAEHGDTLIEAYKAKDAPVVADIKAKYETLHTEAQKIGVDTPVDGQAFANNARVALRKKLLGNDVPTSVKADLESFAAGEPMTFEDFESMRTKLAQEMRDNPSGNQRTAAGIVRQALEDVPLAPGAATLKPFADAARTAARTRFDALEADPAYEAAVNDKVAPDHFVSKFITSKGATRDSVAQMRKNLADNPTATQTMGVASMDELTKAAGVTPMGEGKFGQSRYNSRLDDLAPKLQATLPPDILEHARTLGKVGRYIKEAPEGDTVNRSNTLSGAIAKIGGKVAKSAANVATKGVAGPVIDFMQANRDEAALKAELESATAPLAGVTRRPP